MSRAKKGGKSVDAHLVVEPAFRLEVVEELRVRLTAPDLHVRDLEVTPDCEPAACESADGDAVRVRGTQASAAMTYSGTCCRSPRRSPR